MAFFIKFDTIQPGWSIVYINPYKPSVLFVGQRQTVGTLIRNNNCQTSKDTHDFITKPGTIMLHTQLE